MHIFTYAYAHTYVYIYIYVSGLIFGGTVGSRFCSCKLALPNPNHYVFHAQAKKKSLQKCNPSLDKSSLQNPKDLTRGLQETLQKSRRCL